MSYVDPDAALKIEYADLGVSTGYIGDVGVHGDTRSFRVFTKLATRPGADCCDISVPIFDVPRDHRGVWRGKIVYDTPEVRAKLDRIRERFRRGELFAVAGHRWQRQALLDASAGKVPTCWNG